MAKAHPPAVKARALALAAQGMGSSAIARTVGVAQGTAWRWLAESPSTAAILSSEIKKRRLVVAAKATAFVEDAVDVAHERLHDPDDRPSLYTAVGAMKVGSTVADGMFFGPAQTEINVAVDARHQAVNALGDASMDELRALLASHPADAGAHTSLEGPTLPPANSPEPLET